MFKPMDKTTSFTVHDLPIPERPRERLKRFGPEALSAQELLALVIGRDIPGKSVMNIAQSCCQIYIDNIFKMHYY